MSMDDDLERRLDNWARWCLGKGGRSRNVSSIYRYAARSKRDSEPPIPIINAEAIETDTAMQRLDVDQRNALRARYVREAPGGEKMSTFSEVEIAEVLGVSYRTYLRRVCEAKTSLAETLRAIRAGRKKIQA